MKAIFLLISFCFATSAFAAVWNCVVKNPNQANQPIERVSVDFEQNLSAVTYIHQVPNNDGSFTEKSESLYSANDNIRGGIPTAFCDSDAGHIELQYKMINWTSKCSTLDKQNPLFFTADFHLDRSGYIQTQVLDLQGGKDFSRFIRIDSCK